MVAMTKQAKRVDMPPPPNETFLLGTQSGITYTQPARTASVTRQTGKQTRQIDPATMPVELSSHVSFITEEVHVEQSVCAPAPIEKSKRRKRNATTHAEFRYDEEEYLEEMEQLLAEAVRIRLISEVPLGALLSGGTDSSTVVALMARASSKPVKTFAIGFRNEDFNEAVRIAQAEFDMHQPNVVVGSSRGGAVAMNINSGEAKLVLLCPARRKWGTTRTVKPGTIILHSRADDVVPFADSEELARTSGATLIEVGNDHRLADPEPLAAMLAACAEA